MATSPGSNDPLPPSRSEKKKRSWLSTDEWLGVPSTDTPLPATPAERTDRPADPGSAVRFGQEAVTAKPPSSQIIARSDLADQIVDDEAIDLATPPGGATTGPPSLSKILKATGTKSDILRGGAPKSGETSEQGSGRLPKPASGDSRTNLSRPAPSGDDADIFSTARGDGSGPASGTGSNVLPGFSGVGRSSVFSDASRPSGVGLGAESDLFVGLTGSERGSSVFDDTGARTSKVASDDDLFRSAVPSGDEGEPSDIVRLVGEANEEDSGLDARPIGSGPPSSAKLADRLLAGLADSGGFARPDFNTLDKSSSSSNLFDDVTALDIDLSSEPGGSGLNWLEPNRAPSMQDSSGPGSSIFLKPPSEDISDPGRVDISQIPLLGSTDDPAHQVPVDAYGGADSVMKKEIDKAVKELRSNRDSVTFDLPVKRDAQGKIIVDENAALDRQVSMRMPVSDDELDLAAPAPSAGAVSLPAPRKPKKESDSVFDDVLELPSESGILVKNSGSMAGSILQGMTSDRLRRVENAGAAAYKPTAMRPPSAYDIDLGRKSRKSQPIWIAASLVLGTLAGAGGMWLAMPGDASRPLPKLVEMASTSKFDTPTAQKLLAEGDPVAALDVFEKVADQSPGARAGRGQARWLTRLREAASENKSITDNDAAIRLASNELRGVLAEPLESPEDQKAGLQAALHLGLIHEATGKPLEAVKVYESAAKKLPAYKAVFTSARKRVAVMQTGADGGVIPDGKYTLAPADVLDLASANLILIEFAPVSEIEDEPGFHFWEAVGHASGRSPDSVQQAIRSLEKARSVHLSRRAKLIGKGLNPLSDPSEQMFLRACDELKQYWKIKGRLYGDASLAGTSGGAEKIIADLVDAKQRVKGMESQLAAEAGKAAEALKAASAAQAEVTAAKTASQEAEKAIASLKKELDAARDEAGQHSKTASSLRMATEDAERKLKAADAALDPLLAQLKQAKLLDEKATREQAIAALPEAFKRAVQTGIGDAATVAKELAAVREKAAGDLAAANRKIEELNKQAQAAEQRAQAEVRTARQQIEEERRQVEIKLREQAEAFQQQIAAARAGVVVAITDIERKALDEAEKAYGLGLEAYYARRMADAETHLKTATLKNPNDARYWYFLGLARWQQGRNSEAEADFRRGAALEARGLAVNIGNELVRVQGPARAALDAVRP